MATGRVPTTANSPLTTKGDLFTYDTSQARLAVGSNGETLVADSSATTGLRYQGNYSAGKNKVINGDFGIWQRGTSFTTANTFTADRFNFGFNGGGTQTVTRETFTPGAAPFAGNESTFFLRWTASVAQVGGTFSIVTSPLEDARIFAGQTVTLSYYAKANASIAAYQAPQLQQNFGTGGSPSATVTTNAASTPTYTTAWTRYSFTVALPSISGKTFGTNNNSYINIIIPFPINNTFTVDIWGVQLEAGSVATAFQTATGTLAGELAACQRYYLRTTANATYAYVRLGIGTATSTTAAAIQIPLPVTMRGTVTTLGASNLGLYSSGSIVTVTSLASDQMIGQNIGITANVASGLTQDRAYQLIVNNSSTGYLELGAEL